MLTQKSSLVKKAALEADKVQAPILQSYDLTVAQYKFLKKLYYSPKDSVRVMDLENTFSMTHSTAIDILQVLEKKGYTTRIVNPKDARSKIVSLTDNDELYAATKKYPGRFYGYATLPVDDVEASVIELERCIKELGFVGVMINGPFDGHFLDEERFFPIFEKAAELDVRLNGKQIGRKAGATFITKKSIEAKKKIIELSKDFNGTLNDTDCIKVVGISRNAFYKYKREIKIS